MKRIVVAMAVAALVALAAPASAQDNSMTFFVSSVGVGSGSALGGLDGADAHCQMLATAAGVGDHTWQAYLSTTGPGGVNARDRIGSGPWYNAEGVMVAENVAALHSDAANMGNDVALNESGGMINGEDMPNRHDILTGSDVDGMAVDMTCENWTASGAGSAMVGHHDQLTFGEPGSPWNSAHPSGGCSQEDLVGTGGAGLLYCFATD